jgi:plasmid stabilization system protein ParE
LIDFSDEASADLRDYFSYVAERSASGAGKMRERLFTVLSELEAGDYEGPEDPLTTGERVRSWAVPPLRVFYQRRDNLLHVVRVFHQARRPIARRGR